MSNTVRDIALTGKPSDIFYMAANQNLINTLTYAAPNGILPHNGLFKNMVATILLETARREPGQGREASYNKRLDYTLTFFNRMDKMSQVEVLNKIWDDCYHAVAPSTDASAMIDGEHKVTGKGSLPSSIRRVDGTGFFARIEPGPIQNAWAKWNIGFRIDGGKGGAGSSRNDLTRISTEGSKPLQKHPDLALKIIGKYYHGHRSNISPDLYIGYQNRDLYNESGTCVSRSLFGATAFPYRDTENAKGGLPLHLGGGLEFQYLFAIDCNGAKGVDTEQVQVQMKNDSLWRPGEKAFAGFDADRILGWTRIVRMGQQSPVVKGPLATGWSFKFVDSQWTWLKQPGQELSSYLDAELATWVPGATYNISAQYDFQQA
jgi:hypothetical protein